MEGGGFYAYGMERGETVRGGVIFFTGIRNIQHLKSDPRGVCAPSVCSDRFNISIEFDIQNIKLCSGSVTHHRVA